MTIALRVAFVDAQETATVGVQSSAGRGDGEERHERLAQADRVAGRDRGTDVAAAAAAAAQGPSAVGRAEQRGQEHAAEPSEAGPGPGVAENDRAHRRLRRRQVCV